MKLEIRWVYSTTAKTSTHYIMRFILILQKLNDVRRASGPLFYDVHGRDNYGIVSVASKKHPDNGWPSEFQASSRSTIRILSFTLVNYFDKTLRDLYHAEYNARWGCFNLRMLTLHNPRSEVSAMKQGRKWGAKTCTFDGLRGGNDFTASTLA